MTGPIDPRKAFSAKALYEALDAQRRARGMNWEALAHALHVSVSTMKGMEQRAVLEADGILQMTWWLGRSVQSFAPGGGDDGQGPEPGDWGTTGRVLRFDGKALYAALEAVRAERAITWRQMAAEISPTGLVTASTLTGLAKGGRGDIYRTLAIIGWLGERYETFTHFTDR